MASAARAVFAIMAVGPGTGESVASVTCPLLTGHRLRESDIRLDQFAAPVG
jgi:hypothetical protein